MQVKEGKHFYDFQFNTRLVKSTIAHFQVDKTTFSTMFAMFGIKELSSSFVDYGIIKVNDMLHTISLSLHTESTKTHFSFEDV